MYLGRKVNIIVAASENGVIGFKGAIPWDFPEDRRRFAELTAGRTVIMGRKTLDSIGYPLRGRKNVVLTKKPELIKAEISDTPIWASVNIEAAICMDEEEVWVIGGQKPYRDGLKYADVIYMTRVHTKIAGDRYFPFDESEWKEIEREDFPEYSFIKYVRNHE